ncbi:Protein of unknown function [Lactobacillus helveticus CIRM-BIA 104]|nr:Protein of unknown function [Lactobacillus helveticus CIRM-BIA 104]CDI64045.1 Protein of unknown function [Lactobacillus helveticus CIRM-BIA 103]
MTIKSDK